MPKSKKREKKPDDFASVAARLGCDPDIKAFDAKLKKIAKAKSAPKSRKSLPL
jgi:hypothetical protein